MDIQKEREAFEAWFESRYDAHFMWFALDLDLYVDKHTQTCWEAWQAAKAQAVPEGFVLVQKDLVQSIHQSCVNSLIAESMPAFKAVANTIIDELSPLVRVIQAEA